MRIARWHKLRTRLRLIIMAGAGVGMLLLAVVFLAYTVNLLSSKRNQQVHAELGVLATNIAASIVFEHESSARELLQGLAVDSDILFVELKKLNADFELTEVFKTEYQAWLKEYRQALMNVDTQKNFAKAYAKTPKFSNGSYFVVGITLPNAVIKNAKIEKNIDLFVHGVMVDGEEIAFVKAYVSRNELHQQVTKTFALAVFIFMAVGAFIFLISHKLQQSITFPIEKLSLISRRVTQDGDYALRSDIVRNDEIGELALAFNRMLDQIEQRDLMLEKTVQQRTAELERLANEFRYRAFHDSLTGLPNRALLAERFTTILAHAKRHQKIFALFLMDLDNFKNINDTLGHDVGDELLVIIADRLTTTLRDEDFICRLGGDEFLIITENLPSQASSNRIAEKLFGMIAAPLLINGKHLNVTMSLGGALYPEHGSDMTTLKRAADIAMYASKDSGRNQFKLFENSMEVTAKHRLMVQNDLRGALKNGDVKLFFQPQVNAKTHELYGCEVLVRWYHEKHGLLYPDVFIPYAEESGLVQLVDYYVLDMACKQGMEWLQEGRAMVVSINLSGLHFRNHDIVGKVKDALARHQFPAQYLGVELTEAVLIADSAVATQVVTELKAIGLRISLDDFGVGYSSLNYLRTLPLDVVKLDKSFVQSILVNSQDQRLTEGILKLAASLNLHVVAEGVEEKDQMDYLLGINCAVMQGYYFLPPRAKEEFERWCDHWLANV
ncbi:MAG: EAL domain-containing protein [Marinagarivorans sp.]|nr:EAL domain-containing protein [Marinagarivorans sp.]